MNKLLIVVLVAAAGLLVWLALSKPEGPEAAGSGPAEMAARAAGQSKREPPAMRAAAPVSQVAVAGQTPPARFVSGPPGTPGGGPMPGTPGPVGTPTPLPVAANAALAPGQMPQGVPVPAQGMVEAPTASVKASVRRYWSNLPKSGAVPPRITAEELLPPEVIAAMKIPPQSQITMLGDYALTDPKSFKIILEKPDQMQSMMGVTAILPDGRQVRDYVRLNPPPGAAP